ncbi:MAG TPA: DEAD/DEAH box helicase [Acidimicrobiales bacterium]
MTIPTYSSTGTVNFDRHLTAGRLYPFQTVGVAMALVERRCFIADEMGLGKTVQALTACEVDGAFPAVVVCPAGLKDNWRIEIERFFPHRRVEVLKGNGPGSIPSADFWIVGWPTLESWLSMLLDSGPFKALILDESHYASYGTSRRTQAAKTLSKTVEFDGLRLALTGTPINNRPEELIPQLEIIDRLYDIAPQPRFAWKDQRSWAESFKTHFCGPDGDLEGLHRRLRGCCYIRREREDVGAQITAGGFKATVRRDVRLTLNGELELYRDAEQDLIRYLYETRGAAAARGAVRSRALLKMAILRRRAGEAKTPVAIEWIANFLDSNPDRSLVVFAHHRAVQRRLVDTFDCAHILGVERDPEEQKRQFMSGDSRLIVCSLSAAREGHNLTRAADVLFVEQAWTPGAMQQAEDRANRIGQTAEQVFAWNLLAEGTIDLRVTEILEQKRDLFDQAARGGSSMASILLYSYL